MATGRSEDWEQGREMRARLGERQAITRGGRCGGSVQRHKVWWTHTDKWALEGTISEGDRDTCRVLISERALEWTTLLPGPHPHH